MTFSVFFSLCVFPLYAEWFASALPGSSVPKEGPSLYYEVGTPPPLFFSFCHIEDIKDQLYNMWLA